MAKKALGKAPVTERDEDEMGQDFDDDTLLGAADDGDDEDDETDDDDEADDEDEDEDEDEA